LTTVCGDFGRSDGEYRIDGIVYASESRAFHQQDRGASALDCSALIVADCSVTMKHVPMSSLTAQQRERWYAWSAKGLAERLETDLEAGLSQPEARQRLADLGPNELPAGDGIAPWRIFLSQFSSLIIWVLIAAAVISGLLEEWIDTGAILAIVALNAVLGFIQEYRAEQSLEALGKLSITYARVIRDKTRHVVPSRNLVPGDIIEVEAGDHVPADARLLYVAGLRTLEATLTGESTPVDKVNLVLEDADVAVADQRNMLFLGTTSVSGKGRAVVVATGSRTRLGRIATLMTTLRSEPTPLQRRLEQLGHALLYASLAIVTLVFGLGVLRGEPLVGMFLTAVSLAVAAIPEGLPAIVTMTLALGVTRMAGRNALIRRLPAVETLGSATVICTDKTGTLTKNEMTVTRLFAGGTMYEVTGEGYSPDGTVTAAGASSPAVRDLLAAAVLCNGATLCKAAAGWAVVGDPTEAALLVAAAKIGLDKNSLEARSSFVGEIPFDSERKLMTVVRQSREEVIAYTKGAPDLLLLRCTTYEDNSRGICPMTDSERRAVMEANHVFARNGLRVIGVARRTLEQDSSGDCTSEAVERELIFIGLAAMKDPLRPEARQAVECCRQAGIRTVMITGDHRDTALAIARDATIVGGEHQILTGLELDRLSDEDLAVRVQDIGVYARVSAEHKLRIVRAWRERGAVVAMTGDGVNDAPAVKEADIGIAMGLAGTDVTKAASDMVVTDDNFASIAAAVEEGRGIYDNIRKSVHYLLSCNLSEVLVMLGTTVAGLPLPLLPAQILWINLVTDGIPALALAADPYAPDLMRRPPRHPSAPMFDASRTGRILWQGLLLALAATAAFLLGLHESGQDVAHARTMTFCTLVLAQLAHAFTCRSEQYSVFRIGVATNRPLIGAVVLSALLQVGIVMSPWGQEIFRVVSLDAEQWLLTVGLGLLPWLAIEIQKATRTRRS
jgi:Ca2+-transporting ATPase